MEETLFKVTAQAFITSALPPSLSSSSLVVVSLYRLLSRRLREKPISILIGPVQPDSKPEDFPRSLPLRAINFLTAKRFVLHE